MLRSLRQYFPVYFSLHYSRYLLLVWYMAVKTFYHSKNLQHTIFLSNVKYPWWQQNDCTFLNHIEAIGKKHDLHSFLSQNNIDIIIFKVSLQRRPTQRFSCPSIGIWIYLFYNTMLTARSEMIDCFRNEVSHATDLFYFSYNCGL